MLDIEPGGIVYVLVDFDRARPVLGLLSFRGVDSGDRQFRRMIDSTGFATAALYQWRSEEGYTGTRFRLVAGGRYPAGWARLAMRCGRAWRGTRSPYGRFWSSDEGMISLGISRREAHVSSFLHREPVDPFYSGGGTEVPAGFTAFSPGAAVALWLENPGTFLNERLTEMRIPLEIPAEQLFAGLFPVPYVPAGNGAGITGGPFYELHLRITVASEMQAAGFATVITMARAFLAPAPEETGAAALVSILFANPASADGRNINLRSAPLSASEVAALINGFQP